MMLPILTSPNYVLEREAVPVGKAGVGGDGVRELMEAMEETLVASGGVGLAAPQVGESLRIVAIDEGLIETRDSDEPTHRVLLAVDPRIVWHGDDVIAEPEGCLSFPNVMADVERYAEVRVEFIDEHGRERSRNASGLLSRCFQHEIDHLDGIAIPDRLRGRSKLRFAAAYLAHMRELGDPGTFQESQLALAKLPASMRRRIRI